MLVDGLVVVSVVMMAHVMVSLSVVALVAEKVAW